MKFADIYERSVWCAALASAPEQVDEEGPLPIPDQAIAAAEYADALVEEFRKRNTIEVVDKP